MLSIVAPAEVAADPANQLTLELSTGGKVVILLRPDAAPAHVERIKRLSARLLQRPDLPPRMPASWPRAAIRKGTGEGGSDASRPQGRVQHSAVPARNGRRGARRGVRTAPTASSSSCSRRNATLNDKYTVFGRVIEGMDAVDEIAPGEPPAAADEDRPRRAWAAKARAMRVDLFDFDLPAERIALRPARPRDCGAPAAGRRRDDLRPGGARPARSLLRPGDMLVFNDTRVIPAQLEGRRGEARIGATLHKREGPRDWWAFVRNAKRLRDGDIDRIRRRRGGIRGRTGRGRAPSCFTSMATSRSSCCSSAPGGCRCRPTSPRSAPADEADRDDYQTMFAREDGAVAAPTAALHFTARLIAALDEARHRARNADPARRRRHLPAGQGGGHERAQDARRMGPDRCGRPPSG